MNEKKSTLVPYWRAEPIAYYLVGTEGQRVDITSEFLEGKPGWDNFIEYKTALWNAIRVQNDNNIVCMDQPLFSFSKGNHEKMIYLLFLTFGGYCVLSSKSLYQSLPFVSPYESVCIFLWSHIAKFSRYLAPTVPQEFPYRNVIQAGWRELCIFHLRHRSLEFLGF